jgi:beta-glucanase (GH16 family)
MRNLLILIITLLLPFVVFSQCYNLVWEDEFTGTTLDNTKWFHQTQIPAGGNWYNGEMQHYTDRTDNSYVQNGIMRIVAKEETFTDQGYTKQHTSARLNSKFAFTYGRVEIRAKLPSGVGTWPAMWMLGQNIYEDGAYWETLGYGAASWPACGEIDIMEHWGSNQDYIQSAMHTPSSSGATVNYGGQVVPDVSTEYHIYALEWTEDKMVFSVDGVNHYTYEPTVQDANTWPFDANQYILLNIAILPNISPNFTESSMEVDYVRVYQITDGFEIAGDITVMPNSSATYSIPNIAATTYVWSVPSGSTITSGAGTNEITVNIGNTSGNVGVTMTNGCGTVTKSLVVSVTSNLALNPGFEDDFAHWGADIFAGVANFTISTTDVYAENKSMCVDVTAVGGNAWEIQFSPDNPDILAGEDYTIEFWAKANIANKQMSVAVINNADFSYYGGETYSLTTDWAMYSFSFTAPVSVTAQINLEFGHETGQFCIDEYVFSRAITLPVELLSFDGELKDKEVLLNWETANETNFSHFEIERSMNGRDFEYIGRENSTNETGSRYYFNDIYPLDMNYYRLKIVDVDGSFSYSNVININQKEASSIKLYPTASSDIINLEGFELNEIISIYNSKGQLMKSLRKEQESILSMNISDLVNGVYFITTDKGNTLKFIKI